MIIHPDTQRFIDAVGGGQPSVFRMFHDSKKGEQGINLNSFDPETIDSYQALGYGCYMIINSGGHRDSDISPTGFRASFIDIDCYKGDQIPTTWHRNPHIMVTRVNPTTGLIEAVHAYWLLQIGATVNPDDWRRVQRQLANHYNTDRSVINPSRVMRLPGTKHLKTPEAPGTYTITHMDAVDHRYTLEQVAHGLPPVAEESTTNYKRGEVLGERDDPQTRAMVTRYLERATPAVEGQGGDTTTFATAAKCREYGLPQDVTLDLMLEHWNPRCDPPWDDSELETVVRNAYAYASRPQGAGNAAIVFDQALAGAPAAAAPLPVPAAETTPVPVPTAAETADTPPIPTPAAGPDDYDDNHTVNATVFLRNKYPGKRLWCCESTFYSFNGRVWERRTDQDIETELLMDMLASSPKASTVNGTMDIIGKLTNHADYNWNEFIGWPESKNATLIVFHNGIVDINNPAMLLEHNQNYLTTTCLPYDYDPGARCDFWLRWLDDIFQGDQERVTLLQEWFGYMLAKGDYTQQKILMLIGVGRSGKGTIGRVLEAMVGSDNFSGISLENLVDDAVLESVVDSSVLFFGDEHSVTPTKRNVIASQAKKISGGDKISFNRKWKGAWRGHLPGRMVIACNQMLAFLDDSGALANRFLIIPFNKSALGKEDPYLYDKLITEISGICNWAIQGLHNLRARGYFVEPAAAMEERDEMRSRYSPLEMFGEECLIFDGGSHVLTEEMFDRYRDWCAKSGNKPQPKNAFTSAMRSTFRGHIEKKAKRVGNTAKQAFFGCRLKPVALPQPGDMPAGARPIPVPVSAS